MSITPYEDTVLLLKDVSQLPYRLIRIGDEFGKGGYSRVYKVRDATSGIELVKKRIVVDGNSRDNFDAQKVAFMNEVIIMRRLKEKNAPHIVKLFAAYSLDDSQEMNIIMHTVAEGDLDQYLSTYSRQRSKFSDLDPLIFYRWFGCLAMALKHIHARSIRHKDIKPKNILIRNGSVLLADFGIATDRTGEGGMTTTGDRGPITYRYSAPEVLKDQPRNDKSDVFSLGCVYFEMANATGLLRSYQNKAIEIKSPYADHIDHLTDICQVVFQESVKKSENSLPEFLPEPTTMVNKHERLRILNEASRSVTDVTHHMLRKDQVSRLSAKDVAWILKQDHAPFCEVCYTKADRLADGYDIHAVI